MAKLLQPSLTLDDSYMSDGHFDYEKYQRIWEEFEEQNDYIKFPVADGYAVYKVVTLEPEPVLQHLQYGDAWHAHPALLRGLLKEEVVAMLKAEKMLKELFKNKDL